MLWQKQEARLGRFFAKGLRAELESPSSTELDLILLPNKSENESTGNHGDI